MPPRTTSPKTQHRAAELRHNPTEAEAKLWRHLRAHRLQNAHFRRQHAIGNNIVDFCSPRQKIIIELDGSQHLYQKEYDAERAAFLEAGGYRILRFWNNAVMNDTDGVLREIELALEGEADQAG